MQGFFIFIVFRVNRNDFLTLAAVILSPKETSAGHGIVLSWVVGMEFARLEGHWTEDLAGQRGDKSLKHASSERLILL